MFIIVQDKYAAIDVFEHERMVSTPSMYFNKQTNEWAIKISGDFNHFKTVAKELKGGGWECVK
jgi:hypothetical protein